MMTIVQHCCICMKGNGNKIGNAMAHSDSQSIRTHFAISALILITLSVDISIEKLLPIAKLFSLNWLIGVDMCIRVCSIFHQISGIRNIYGQESIQRRSWFVRTYVLSASWTHNPNNEIVGVVAKARDKLKPNRFNGSSVIVIGMQMKRIRIGQALCRVRNVREGDKELGSK